jgi:hypothetical protein
MRRCLLLRPGTILTAVSLLLAFSCGTCAQAFSADVVGTGTLIAWLSGLELVASITGRIQLTGEAMLGGQSVGFSAEGTVRGFGVRGIVTLISEGWIGYVASGFAANDEPIEISGLLYAMRKSLIPLRAGDVFVGAQHAVIVFRGEAHSFGGEFSGSVEGALQPSETPGTIQLGGTGTVHLEAKPGGLPTSILLDHPALTPEFLQYVAELGLGT